MRFTIRCNEAQYLVMLQIIADNWGNLWPVLDSAIPVTVTAAI